MRYVYRVERVGETFYERIAERVGNADATELLRRNAREERGHAERLREERKDKSDSTRGVPVGGVPQRPSTVEKRAPTATIGPLKRHASPDALLLTFHDWDYLLVQRMLADDEESYSRWPRCSRRDRFPCSAEPAFEALLALPGELLGLLFFCRELGLVRLCVAFLVLILGHGPTVTPFSGFGTRTRERRSSGETPRRHPQKAQKPFSRDSNGPELATQVSSATTSRDLRATPRIWAGFATGCACTSEPRTSQARVSTCSTSGRRCSASSTRSSW